MLDVVLLALFVLLPLATWLVSRSLTWTAVSLAFGFGVAGNAVQSLISLGITWNVRGLQWLVVGVMALVLALSFFWSRRSGGLRRQLLAVVFPALLLAAFLIAMRLMAPESPGPLTAVGYLFNHPQAEDNAKWLNLTAQLADGRDIAFNGYAGGPLLLVMGMMAALISVLSQILLAGVNEVAVAANAVIGTQFLLIALIPFVIAPFVEKGVLLRGEARRRVPWPAAWIAMLVLVIASAVITSYGHLSLQWVLLVLVLWSAVFLVRIPGRARLLMTLVVVCTASVWVPFNFLGLALLAGCLAWVLRSRDWMGLAACVVTLASVWDALISSVLFTLGINLGVSSTSSGGDSAASSSGASGDAAVATSSALADQVENARSLFTAPGGVEQIQPLVAGLAFASVVFAVWLIARADAGRWQRFVPFLPIAVLGIYLLLIDLGDAITTGGAPHYGGHKLAFAFTIMALVSTLPIAVAGIDRSARGMTAARWFAVGGVVLVLTLDTMLPRALSALSPVLWSAVDSSSPAHWAAAEVKPVADQPISSLPIACAFAPPVSDLPTALPLGQEAYTCTRLLLGLNGLEGKPTVLAVWLQTDWMSNSPTWDYYHDFIAVEAAPQSGRKVILMNSDGGTAGLTTLGSLLQQYPVATQ